MLRLSMPLISVHDLPAAIRSRSRSSSSGVQRILGITQSFAGLQPELDQVAEVFRNIRGGSNTYLFRSLSMASQASSASASVLKGEPPILMALVF
jgi:hypothetical protein